MAIWTPADEYDEEELKDLALAIGLLTGTWDAEKAAKRYYSPGEEKLGRKAIANLLRSQKPFDSALRRQLAALFDFEDEQPGHCIPARPGIPPSYSSFAGAMERKLVFEFRRTGKPDVTLRNLHLASDYRDAVESGLPHQKAVALVCKKYGVSDTAVKKARHDNPILKPRKAVIKRRKRPA
jgi:hypothetical protein